MGVGVDDGLGLGLGVGVGDGLGAGAGVGVGLGTDMGRTSRAAIFHRSEVGVTRDIVTGDPAA